MKLSIGVKPALILFLLLFVSSALMAQTSPFRIIGYVPSWSNVPLFTQTFDFKQVTHLNYAFQNPDASGNLVGTNNGLVALVTKAHANNVKVLVSIGGGLAAEGTIKTYFHNLVSTSEKRADFIHKIALYLSKYELDGLDVDEEGPAINSNYGAFIKQLADSLKPKGYLLTTAVGWGNESIQNTTLSLFDYVTLMAYDYTGDWNQTKPGQHAPYWYAQQMINTFVARGVKKEKLCLGLPFYGYGFYKKPGSYNYKTLLTDYPDAWQKDQVADTIYYNGMNTIWKKTKLALAQTSGVMIWELSNEVTGERSLLRVINATIDSVRVPVTANVLKVNEMNIYPNPANDYLILQHPGAFNIATVNIVNLSGSVVKTLQLQPAGESDSRINISALSKGEYICQVSTPEGNFAKIFFKE